MSAPWAVSGVLAWVAIALLVTVVVSLMRQVGELRAALEQRAGEDAGARIFAAELYDRVEPFTAVALDGGGRLELGGEQDRPTLLVVHRPGCSSCAGIDASLAQLAGDPTVEARVVSVLGLQAAEAAAVVARRPADGVPAIAVEDLPPALEPASLPALIALAREGVVCALGAPSVLDDLREAARAAAEAELVGAPDSRRVTDWGVSVPFWEPAAL